MLNSILFGISTLVVAATANIYIYMPDNSSTWYTGSTGNVLWNSTAAEFTLQCRIELISVDTEDVVYNMTEKPIPCSVNKYTSHPLPLLDGERFLIRIGQDDSWDYTQDFTILNATTPNDGVYQDY